MIVNLDLLTMNLWGLPWPVARARRARKRRFLSHLLEETYDIVGIQELWWPWRSSLPLEHFDLPPSVRDSGLALAGRLKAGTDVHVEHFRDRTGIERLKHKGMLAATVVAGPGVEIAVYVTHLQAGRRGAAVRARQIDQLLERLDAETRPAVVMGDFNLFEHEVDDHRSAERIADAGFIDAAEAGGAAHATYCSKNPYVRRRNHAERFDRVLLRDAAENRFEIVSVDVCHALELPFSDHHPVHVRTRLHG